MFVHIFCAGKKNFIFLELFRNPGVLSNAGGKTSCVPCVCLVLA